MASTKQMYDYLKLATIMEGDVRAAKLLKEKIESRADEICATKYYTQDNYDCDVSKAKKAAKKAKILPILAIVYFVMAAIGVFSDFPKEDLEGDFKTFFYIFLAVLVLLFIVLLLKLRSNKLKKINEVKDVEAQATNKLEYSNNLKEKNDALMVNYQVQYNEVVRAYNQAVSNLKKLYSENILPVKYRNYSAVATMYQWLRDGRCTQIYGHGGLFDTYEYEVILGEIVNKIEEINRKLDKVIENQSLLLSEVRRSNEIAEKTYQSVRQIESMTERIESNSESIKANTEVIAMNSRYQTRMQEYANYHRMYY